MRAIKRIALVLLGLLIVLLLYGVYRYHSALDYQYEYSEQVSQLPLVDQYAADGTYRIRANGMEFLIRVAGLHNSGENLILLHGFPETSIMWQPLMEQAASHGYRVIAFDQRGYSPGARPEAIEAYELSNLVEDVMSIAQEMQIDSFHLVGHDWGAIVGLLL